MYRTIFPNLKQYKLCMELSVIELNLSILKWNPGHLDGIYANPCENLHHFSRIYYITNFTFLLRQCKLCVELSVIELNL